MSDPNNPNIKSRTTPQWGLYRRALFCQENTGELPPFSIDPSDLEDLANKASELADGTRPPPTPDNPTPTSQTAKPSNFTATAQSPRKLIDTNVRDTSSSIFGHRFSHQ